MAASIYIQMGESNAEAVATELRRRGSSLRTSVLAAVQDLGAEAVSYAKALAPVRRGKLQGSIYAKVSEPQTGAITLVVRPAKRGWYGVFAEFPQVQSSTSVKGYVRHSTHGDRLASASTSKRGKLRQTYASSGVTFVTQYTRRIHLRHHPFISPARDLIAERGSVVVREAIRQALEGA